MNAIPCHAALACAAAIFLTACGLQRFPPKERPSRPQLVQPAPARSMTPTAMPTAAPATSLPAADAAVLVQARSRYAEARSLIADWPDAAELQTLLAAAEGAARSGDAAGVRGLAGDVLRRSTDALELHDQLRAGIELQKVQTYTGLSDAQLERLRIAEVVLASRQGRQAWELLSALSRELAEATRRYVVAAGDSLWIISGRPEVYGNPYLWPLIWDANLDAIRNPDMLRAGQRLKIRTNPRIDEVVRAIETARSYRSPSVRIGEVREATP